MRGLRHLKDGAEGGAALGVGSSFLFRFNRAGRAYRQKLLFFMTYLSR